MRQGIVKPHNERGYLRVNLSGDKNKTNMKRVHRLVALAFLKPPSGNRDEVNHKDGNKRNNHINNLEWATRLENMQHCDANNLRSFSAGSKHGCAKLTESEVELMRLLYASGNTSYPKLSRMFGISISSAQRTVTKQTWKTI